MSGYIGKSQGVTQVDGYTRSEADAEYVNDPNAALNISSSASANSATIDASGNLLVGKTTVDNTTTGIMAKAGGQLSAVVQDAAPLFANRTNSDGDILLLRKDNTTVGSIGTGSGTMYIGSGTNGLKFDSGIIRSWNPTTNAIVSDARDIGASDSRFKDLYLSGGVYLGGTGSANHLDDYEEGTFTVSSTRAGVGEDSGGWIAKYVKIGRLVHVTISTSDWVRHDGSGYGSGQTFQINTNLPFVPSGQGGGRAAHTRTLANRELISLAWRNGSSTIYLTECGSNNSYNATNNVTTSNTQTNITLTFSGSYYTSQ